MKNHFKCTCSNWVRYSEYEWKMSDDGTLFLVPTKNAQPSIYDPFSEYQHVVLDAINIGYMGIRKKTDIEIQKAIQNFAVKYGLLGLMNALPTTSNFMEYNEVYLVKNHYIREKSMATEDYLELFFPFEKHSVIKRSIESMWNTKNDRMIMALDMTMSDKPIAVNMSFQREYAERYEWIKEQFTDFALNFATSTAYYENYDFPNYETRMTMQQHMELLDGIAPTYHIALRDKPMIVLNCYSLLLFIQMMYSFMLTSTEKPMRLCRFCKHVFVANRPSAFFCSPQCKNKYNVYKTRGKNREKEGEKMPESQNIEWKSKWKDEYLEWICGYANAQGGKIYIGCDDDGNIIGLSNARKLLEDLPNKIRDAMGIIVGVNLYEENGKEYIEIDVPSYPIGISCKGVYYYRSGSARQILTGPALESFLMRKRGATWDNLPLPTFSLSDIDDSIVELFKKWATNKGRIDKSVLDEPKNVLMEKLHLMNGQYLTNAAMLLFSKDPEKWQLGAYVKIGFFENDADLLYQDEVHGSILEQIDKIVELVYLKYMKAKISYNGMQRLERYFVPESALREALLNALCHKQYQSGVPIQISVYEDKLYIANCGCLPANWTLENLMRKHASVPYNPNIAHVFYLTGFIESWGRGIEKICSACEKDGVPQPIYTINPGDIMIEFTAPNDRIIWSDTHKVTDKVTDNLDEKSTKILALISENPTCTTTKVSERLSFSRKTVSQKLKEMKENGIIERIGSDRKGHWKINNYLN